MPRTISFFACVSQSPIRRWGRMPYAYGLVATAAPVLSAGCSLPQHRGAADHGYPASATNITGINVIPLGHVRLLTPEGVLAGTAKLQTVQLGVDILLQVQGIAPRTYGFQTHAKGECALAPDAKTGKMVAFGAAGGYFDPHSTQTHGHPGQSSNKVHAGDVPKLVVGANGRGIVSCTNTGVTLTPRPNSIEGRSLAVHESKGDYKANPAGNSGARIACGVMLMSPADTTPPTVR